MTTATTIEEYADRAAAEIGRWYGQRQSFAAPQQPGMTCRDFLLQHWQHFPSTNPLKAAADGIAADLRTVEL